VRPWSSFSGMPPRSSAFQLLDPSFQNWLEFQGCESLGEWEEAAIAWILGREADVLVAAADIPVRIDAAALPLLTALRRDARGGFRALWVTPLRSLLDDKLDRVGILAEEVGVPVIRWYDHLAPSIRRRVLERPSGVLAITPESLESLFLSQGIQLPVLFGRLGWVVVDELHAFLGTDRGLQLQSLLQRLERSVERRVPRIGLSEPLGDLAAACELLRPARGASVRRALGGEAGRRTRVEVHAFRQGSPRISPAEAEAWEANGRSPALEDLVPGGTLGVGRHLFETLQGGRHLIFANRRSEVDQQAALLRRLCRIHELPNEFWPYHDGLSGERRAEVDSISRGGDRPASVLCVSTLALEFDAGSIDVVAQIGAPPSVASLRRRLGRSGRDDRDAVLRVYVQEPEVDAGSAPWWRLRSELVQALAAVRLHFEGWCEPPEAGALHLSTLVQQVLSFLAQHGSARPESIWRALCGDGPFSSLGHPLFVEILRSLGRAELVGRLPNGTLALDRAGKALANQPGFCSASETDDEYCLTVGGVDLGTLPLALPLFPGGHLFAHGRRWLVLDVDPEDKLVELLPADRERLPDSLGGRVAPVHDRIRREMFDIYRSDDEPPFLDAPGRALLAEGREAFRASGLAERSLVDGPDGAALLPWRGDRILDTLAVWLGSLDLRVSIEGPALTFPGTSLEEARRELARLAAEPPPDPRRLAATVANRRAGKFHAWLSDELVAADYASSRLDVKGAWQVAAAVSDPTRRAPAETVLP
jgi:ATP-dependent helicase Lhr and Lhr-like helicase